MKTNDIITAPQAGDMRALYGIWSGQSDGTFSDFCEFMTTPSFERSRFLESQRAHMATDIDGSVTLQTWNPES